MDRVNQEPGIEALWQAYIASLPPEVRPPANSYDVWYFGDTEEVAVECARLVKAGIKTATSALLWEMEADGEKMPKPGDLVIVTDLSGEPYCIIEVTECMIRPFNEIDDQFAFDYGEGDRTLLGWRKDSWDYFAPICESLGREPGETAPMVCQRFRLVYPFAALSSVE